MASGCCYRALELCHLEQITFLHSDQSASKKPFNSVESFPLFDRQNLEIFANYCFQDEKEEVTRLIAHAYDKQTKSMAVSCYQQPTGYRSLFRKLVAQQTSTLNTFINLLFRQRKNSLERLQRVSEEKLYMREHGRPTRHFNKVF